MKRRKLLIADDSEMNRAILANMLEKEFDIIEATDGRETIVVLQNYREEISALLLDVVMPEMSGFEVLEELRRRQWIEEIPTIMISAETGNSYINRAFELGASDYISRPFSPDIIRRRIVNTILLHTKKQQLMDVVSGWFYRREKNDEVLVSILDYAVELRNGENGTHMLGVSRLTALLLQSLQKKSDRYPLGESDVNAICVASGLHDVGKLLISEEILKKPGKLTAEEFEIVKHHTQIGARIISELPIYQNEKLVKYAMEICRWHHERWNGEGYPDGLAGDDIPIAAQIVALADVYDVLTNERCYKSAYSHEKALSMIQNGECGSFNPLLLDCLEEVADSIQSNAADQKIMTSNIVHRAVENLYQGQNLNAARMTQHFEDANAKQEFMVNLCDEIWFEYTTQPSSLRLSKGAAEQTGLPSAIVEPLKSKEFLEIVGGETVEQLQERLEKLSTDESYLELTVKLAINGKPCRCQLAILVLWSATEQGRCSTLLGKAVNIDEGYERLEKYDKSLGEEATEQILLPVTAGEDDVLKITRKQVGRVIQSYRKMFETVRLVDPGICMQISAGEDGHFVEKNERCFSIWGNARRCERCISQEALRTRKTQSKVETIEHDIYYILAMCIEIDGIPYVLECINTICADKNTMEDENILNQLLVRNRQIYMDSTTKIFNRRYYDARVRNLSGEHALAIIDVDDFKQVNDTFGHSAGDMALYHIAQTIRSMLRSDDALIRYGGDEFVLLFHGLPEQVLERKLQEICLAVQNIEISEYPEMKLSVSIGGVYASGRISDLILKADRALYRAKVQKGRAVISKEDAYDSE